MFKDRLLRKIVGLKRKEITEDWRKQQSEEFPYFVLLVIKSSEVGGTCSTCGDENIRMGF